MPQDKDLKRLVRERMETTGERYAQARLRIVGPAPHGEPQRDDDRAVTSALVDAFGDLEQRWVALRTLKALPDEQLIPVLLHGMSHADWRVRRGCCHLLDDISLTDESITGLQACLEDPHPKV